MFTKSLRTEGNPFEITDFTPGIGHYNTQAQNLDLQKNKQSTFDKNQRFKSYTIHDQGPGSYNIPGFFNKQQKQINNQSLNKKNDAMYIRVNAIPSIPSKNMKVGYQDIGEGLLILIRGNKCGESEEIVGPTSYQPQVKTTKPRVSSCIISQKQESPQQKSDPNYFLAAQKEKERQDELQLIPLKIIKGTNYANRQQIIDKGQHHSQQQAQYNTDTFDFPLKQSYKQSLKSYKNNLLIYNQEKKQRLKEIKQKQKEQEETYQKIFYKNCREKAFTSLQNVKYKQKEFQCFDSSEQRFQTYTINNNENIGPGSYQPVKKESLQGYTYSKQTKKSDWILDNGINLDPGKYQTDVINKPPVKKETEYGAIFGSGVQRFEPIKTEDNNENKQLQINDEKYQRNKRSKSTQKFACIKQGSLGCHQYKSNMMNKKNKLLENDDLNFPDSNKDLQMSIDQSYQENRNLFIQSLKHNQKKKTSCFSSSTNRFVQKYNNMLGPGHYYQEEQLVKNTFNKSSNILDRQNKQYKQINQISKDLGPGSYNIDTNIAKN